MTNNIEQKLDKIIELLSESEYEYTHTTVESGKHSPVYYHDVERCIESYEEDGWELVDEVKNAIPTKWGTDYIYNLKFRKKKSIKDSE